jgi:hypothetical protein
LFVTNVLSAYTNYIREEFNMKNFNKIKWQVLYAGLTILALAIATGAPGQYSTPG